MFKCLRGSAPAYLADYCTSTSLVPGRSALRSAAQGDIVVPSHRTDWSLRSFAVAGPSNWNALPVDLRSSSFGLDTFAKNLKNTSIDLVQHTHDRARTFEFVSHFVECDTVTVSPNQIIIIIIISTIYILYYTILLAITKLYWHRLRMRGSETRNEGVTICSDVMRVQVCSDCDEGSKYVRMWWGVQECLDCDERFKYVRMWWEVQEYIAIGSRIPTHSTRDSTTAATWSVYPSLDIHDLD